MQSADPLSSTHGMYQDPHKTAERNASDEGGAEKVRDQIPLATLMISMVHQLRTQAKDGTTQQSPLEVRNRTLFSPVASVFYQRGPGYDFSLGSWMTMYFRWITEASRTSDVAVLSIKVA